MNWPDSYNADTVSKWTERLENLKPDTQPQWGKMNAGQLLAHLNVTYDMIDGKIPSNNFLVKWMLKTFVKPSVAGPKAYPKNSRTAPIFLVPEEQDFNEQKEKFIANINKVQKLGKTHFEGFPSPSFGPMTEAEWNVTFSKHIEHHFEQFGL